MAEPSQAKPRCRATPQRKAGARGQQGDAAVPEGSGDGAAPVGRSRTPEGGGGAAGLGGGRSPSAAPSAQTGWRRFRGKPHK